MQPRVGRGGAVVYGDRIAIGKRKCQRSVFVGRLRPRQRLAELRVKDIVDLNSHGFGVRIPRRVGDGDIHIVERGGFVVERVRRGDGDFAGVAVDLEVVRRIVDRERVAAQNVTGVPFDNIGRFSDSVWKAVVDFIAPFASEVIQITEVSIRSVVGGKPSLPVGVGPILRRTSGCSLPEERAGAGSLIPIPTSFRDGVRRPDPDIRSDGGREGMDYIVLVGRPDRDELTALAV